MHLTRITRITIPALMILVLPFMVYWLGAGRISDCDLPAALKGASKRLAANWRMRNQIFRPIVTAPDSILWDTPFGKFWVPRSTQEPFLRVVISEQEEDIYSAESMVKPGDVVMDCGADIGTFVRNAIVHGASRVIAVEPAPWKEPCLRKTFAQEIAQGKVTIYPKGVWNTEAELLLDVDTIRSDRGQKVPLTTIDRIVEELQLNRLDLIKMDIEGAEKPAIQGARKSILRFKPRFTIATEHKPDDHSAIPALLKEIVPSYSASCGPCVYQFERFQPYTMQFVAGR